MIDSYLCFFDFSEDYYWGTLTLSFLFVPGLVRGTYEVFRSNVKPNQRKNSAIMGISNKGRNDAFDSYLRPSFTHLNFGLDVIPSLTIQIPDSVVAKVICVPVYIILMACWFPILPIIQ